jgi:PhnB protein
MAKQVKPIPEGFHTVTPHLVVRDGNRAIDFYKRAFGATEVARMPGPDGKSVAHAELKIGDSFLFLCDEFPGMNRAPQSLGGSSVTINLYVEDCDAVFNRAVAAGATVQMPLADQFWGDRYGKLVDPFGHEWAVTTHKEDVSPEEVGKRAQAAFAKMGQKSAK